MDRLAEWRGDHAANTNHYVVCPCLPGDTVYKIYRCESESDKGVIECHVVAMYMEEPDNELTYIASDRTCPSIHFSVHDVGKTIFLTLAEAEKAWKDDLNRR